MPMLTRRAVASLLAGAVASPAVIGHANAQATRLRYANASSDQAICNQFMAHFFNVLRERTNGEVNGQLLLNAGGEQTLLESVSLGTMDIANVAYTGLPQFDVFYTPTMLRDIEHAYRVVKSPIMAGAAEAARQRYNVRLLGLGSSGSFLIGVKSRVADWAELRGKKIRIPAFESYPEACRLLGIAPTPVAFNETYLALQQNLVDGLATLLNVMISSRFLEVCQHVITNDFGVGTEKIVMSERSWNRLSARNRDIFQGTFDELIKPHYFDAATRQLAIDSAAWRQRNGADSMLTLDQAALQALMQPLAQRLAESVLGAGSFERISNA